MRTEAGEKILSAGVFNIFNVIASGAYIGLDLAWITTNNNIINYDQQQLTQ